MLTAAIIGLALFAVLAAGVLALMAARRAAVAVLVLACVLAVAGAALAVVGNRVHANCIRDANNGAYDPLTMTYSSGAVASCDTSHFLGLRDPF